jgi:hypothetical protein
MVVPRVLWGSLPGLTGSVAAKFKIQADFEVRLSAAILICILM